MVHRSRDNWTSLFCAGDVYPAPPALAFEHVARLHNSPGYDGQFYHYIAHDPFLTRGFANYVDAPRLRYSRILLPLLAHLVALGNDHWIDGGYFLVELLSVFLGTYWLSRYSLLQSQSGWFGIGFLIVPGVIISADRMTVDGVLAALTAAFVLFAVETIDWKVYLVAMLAVLTRESGVLFPLAGSVWLLMNRRYGAAALFATAIVPAFAWYLFVLHRTAAEPTTLSLLSRPFYGLAVRLIHPPPVPHLNSSLAALVVLAGYVALAGVLAALALAAVLVAARRSDPRAIAIYLFALMTLMLSARLWTEPTDFGRTMSPLVLLLATISLSDSIPAFMLPLIAIAAPLLASRGIFLLNLVPSMVRP